MSIFLHKSIAFGRYRVTTLAQTSNVCYSLRWFSVSSSSDKEQSFVVSYLIKSLGFSPEAAVTASKNVKFNSPQKPDKVIELFKGYGFTHTQISRLVRAHPKLLSYNVEKNFVPKLEFFRSKGIFGHELAKTLCVFPSALRRSLAQQIMPAYEFFLNFFQSDERTIMAVRRYPNILTYDIEKKVGPNIETLRQHGVPDSKIAALFYLWSPIMMIRLVQFQTMVKEVVEMGFNSSKTSFILAVYAMHLKHGDSKKWERKINVYKKWGWSDEEVSKAFRKNPRCMMISADKITAVMGFFITKMGLRPCDLANVPMFFTYSLEKRTIPRVSIYQALLSRGLVAKEVNISTLLGLSEKSFLQRFVTPYAKEAPDLLKLYKEKLALSS